MVVVESRAGKDEAYPRLDGENSVDGELTFGMALLVVVAAGRI